MDNNVITEQGLGKGALPHQPDERDYQWGELGFGSMPFSWEDGFDIENEVGKLPVKDQGGSSSCGGQAWGYLGQILDNTNRNEKSAKFIYAQTHAPGGGSDGRLNSELVKTKGWGSEALTPSYVNGFAGSEQFYINNDITPEAFKEALTDRALSYAAVNITIDSIAQALRDNKAVIIGIVGQNNGTWTSPFPKPPMGSSNLWYHWVLIGKAKMIGGKKYLGFINSWGETVGEKGWQWISEDYMNWLFSTWTMIKNTPPPPTFQYNFIKNLTFSMFGADVTALQTILKIEGFFSVPATGFFGLVTLAAVKKWQTKHGLKADGYFGILSRTKANELYK